MNGYRTVASIAEQLDVSPRTVLRWIERGDLAAVRLPGRRLRVADTDLAAALTAWSTTGGRMLASIGDEGGES